MPYLEAATFPDAFEGAFHLTVGRTAKGAQVADEMPRIADILQRG
ncbi:MAG TPA: hypothetical protein VN909_08620 [Candidatus Dormibacteraeota bacterium]|nr:hypothetical protein [Candidatus Dormibacteraeota bacterium]